MTHKVTQTEIVKWAGDSIECADVGFNKATLASVTAISRYILLASQVIAAVRVQHEVWGACKEIMRAMKALDAEFPE